MNQLPSLLSAHERGLHESVRTRSRSLLASRRDIPSAAAPELPAATRPIPGFRVARVVTASAALYSPRCPAALHRPRLRSPPCVLRLAPAGVAFFALPLRVASPRCLSALPGSALSSSRVAFSAFAFSALLSRRCVSSVASPSPFSLAVLLPLVSLAALPFPCCTVRVVPRGVAFSAFAFPALPSRRCLSRFPRCVPPRHSSRCCVVRVAALAFLAALSSLVFLPVLRSSRCRRGVVLAVLRSRRLPSPRCCRGVVFPALRFPRSPAALRCLRCRRGVVLAVLRSRRLPSPRCFSPQLPSLVFLAVIALRVAVAAVVLAVLRSRRLPSPRCCRGVVLPAVAFPSFPSRRCVVRVASPRLPSLRCYRGVAFPALLSRRCLSCVAIAVLRSPRFHFSYSPPLTSGSFFIARMYGAVSDATPSNPVARCRWRTALAEGQGLGSPGDARRPSHIDVSRAGHPIHKRYGIVFRTEGLPPAPMSAMPEAFVLLEPGAAQLHTHLPDAHAMPRAAISCSQPWIKPQRSGSTGRHHCGLLRRRRPHPPAFPHPTLRIPPSASHPSASRLPHPTLRIPPSASHLHRRQ